MANVIDLGAARAAKRPATVDDLLGVTAHRAAVAKQFASIRARLDAAIEASGDDVAETLLAASLELRELERLVTQGRR